MMKTAMKRTSIMVMAVTLVLAITAYGFSPAAEPKPAIPLPKALQIAQEHVKKKGIDVSNHYLDRIWVGHVDGRKNRRWIVSWSPDPEKPAGNKSWLIITIKMNGKVDSKSGGVPWISEQYLEFIRKQATSN